MSITLMDLAFYGAAPPTPSLVSQSAARISHVAGFDQTSVVWTVDKNFTGYQFRVVAAGTDPVTSGVLVEQNQSPAVGGVAGTQYTSTLTIAEVEAVSPAEGTKILKLFTQKTNEWASGAWST